MIDLPVPALYGAIDLASAGISKGLATIGGMDWA